MFDHNRPAARRISPSTTLPVPDRVDRYRLVMREQAREWTRLLRPTRSPSSTIYGTIVAAALIATESAADASTAEIVGSVLATLVVYWLAHVYSDLLAPHDRRERPGHPTGHAILTALAEEWGIVAGGLGLVIVLVITDLAGVPTAVAINIALAGAVVELIGWGILAARHAHLSAPWTALYATISAIFGAALVLLKFTLH
jgi:hypothetical protein